MCKNTISLGAGAEAKAVAGSRKKIPEAGAAPKTGRLRDPDNSNNFIIASLIPSCRF